jgi:hypothetical protein
VNLTGTTAMTAGEWYHVMATYDPDTNIYAIWLDGELEAYGTQTLFSDTSGEGLYIGYESNGNSNYYFDGHMEDIRVTLGTTRRKGIGYDVPTRTLETTPSDIDPYRSYVGCLIEGGQEADASTTFTDNSPNGLTVTANGNVQWDDAQAKYATTSVLFDGTGDYLSVAADAALDLTDVDFDIECFVRYASTPSASDDHCICAKWNGAGSESYFLGLRNQNLEFIYYTGSNQTVQWAWAPTGSQWYHVRVSRRGDLLDAYIDGEKIGTTHDMAGATVTTRSSVPLQIGALQTTEYHNGWIEDFRLTVGITRYQPNNIFNGDGDTLQVIEANPTSDSTFVVGDGGAITQIDGVSVEINSYIAAGVNVGDPGLENSAVTLDGVSFDAVMKINEFGGTQDATLILHRHDDSPGVSANMLMSRARGETSSHSAVQDNDVLGRLVWAGWHTDSYWSGARIFARVDGTPGDGDMPTELVFQTTPDGSNTPANVLRLRADGTVQLPTFTNATRPAAGTAGRIIFNSDDGQLNIDDGTNWTLPDGTTT